VTSARKSPPGTSRYRPLNQSAVRQDCFGAIETGSNPMATGSKPNV